MVWPSIILVMVFAKLEYSEAGVIEDEADVEVIDEVGFEEDEDENEGYDEDEYMDEEEDVERVKYDDDDEDEDDENEEE